MALQPEESWGYYQTQTVGSIHSADRALIRKLCASAENSYDHRVISWSNRRDVHWSFAIKISSAVGTLSDGRLRRKDLARARIEAKE